MIDRAARQKAYRERLAKSDRNRLTALVVDRATAHAADAARYRAVARLVAAARAGERVTQRVVARDARCSVRTVGRAVAALKHSQLVNVHAPAPYRDKNGQCVGRDVRGSRLFLALQSRAALAIARAADLSVPNQTRKAASTKSVSRGASQQGRFRFVDGKPAAGPVRQRE
jgi:hypothetical protein